MSQPSNSNRRGLGRGLGALIVSTEERMNPVTPEIAAQAQAGGVQMIELGRIAANPHQPRSHFDEALLQELAASIREHGVIQPLIVTAAGEGSDGFWIVAGERRWRAAALAGLNEVPAILREASPQQLMEWALVENVQRADLNPLEEAAAYASLMEEFGFTQAETAQRVGKSRPAVANTLRLLQLPPALQQAVIDGKISAGHARALLGLHNQDEMEEAGAIVQQRGLSVRQTEELVRKLLDKPQDEAAEIQGDEQEQAQVQHLENRFRSALGTRVNLARNADGSGRLVVHFYNDEDLQHLYQLMVGEEEW
ncbi:MAG: ParB/RepB/Spo0J family partition protein [Caldilineaceae bacterium]|nr:ParB/RepB/Spo0J family partition protein [Caldilineaceae bacterium]